MEPELEMPIPEKSTKSLEEKLKLELILTLYYWKKDKYLSLYEKHESIPVRAFLF
jgi:hypothetical protein